MLPGSPGILRPEAYLRSGDVLGADGARQIQQAFKSYGTNAGGIASLEVFGRGSGLTPSAKTLSFVTNHDLERNRNDYLGYQDGATYTLANEWLIAQGYGSPQVFSSFAWEAADASPPATAGGLVTNTVCGEQWTCVHRNPGIVAMIGWRKYVGSAKRTNVTTDDDNVIAFSRGNRGWAGFNNSTTDEQIRVQTGLPKGTYCDLLHGGRAGGTCHGARISVGTTGFATVTIKAKDALAITRVDRV